MEMPRVVLYARYSSTQQREESIDAQLRAGRQYCQSKNYAIVKEYKDEAFTGTNDNRPAFQQMMADAKNKLFDIVIFHKVDRHSRNEYDYYFSKLQLKKHGVRAEYVAQNIDDSPEGAMMEAMLVGMSAYYSRNLAKEILKGKKETALKGLFNGGTPPIGYKIINQKYVIDDYEAESVKLIFDMYLNGYGYIPIIEALNNKGYKTKRDKPFGKNSLYEILRNARYMGTYILGKTKANTDGKRNTHGVPNKDMIIVENALPSIISKKDFERVAEKMNANKKRSASYKAKNTYLLSGFVYCGNCGAAMQGKTINKYSPSRVYQYYYCGSQSRGGKTACTNTMIDMVNLEKLVLDKVESTLFTPAAKKTLYEKISTSYNKRMEKNTVAHEKLTKQKNGIAMRMDNLYTKIENGIADDYDMERLKKVKEEMTTIRTQIAKIEESTKMILAPEQVQAVIDSYDYGIKNKSAENIYALLENFVNKIIISSDEVIIEFKINFFGIDGAVDET